MNKWAVTFDISYVYFSSVGIKHFNTPITKSAFDYFISEQGVFELPVAKLLIGPDNLKDSYTLLGTPISDSPYNELMQSLNTGQDLHQTEYIGRVPSGILDNRRARPIDTHYLSSLRQRFESQKALIQRDAYHPIKGVFVNGEYYIFDGKHRAALCAILHKTPRCVDVNFLKYDSWCFWLHAKMQKQPDAYRKHLAYFGQIFHGSVQ